MLLPKPRVNKIERNPEFASGPGYSLAFFITTFTIHFRQFVDALG